MSFRIAAILLLLLGAIATLHAEADENDNPVTQMLDPLLNIDMEDPRSVQLALGATYLNCAAFYKRMALARDNQGRPAKAKFFRELSLFYQLVGQYQITEAGKPYDSSTTAAEAYMEDFIHEKVENYSESDIELMHELCTEDSFVDEGKKVLDILEKYSEHGEE